jgi:hypothetical protein
LPSGDSITPGPEVSEAADGRFDLDVVKIFVNRMAVSFSR